MAALVRRESARSPNAADVGPSFNGFGNGADTVYSRTSGFSYFRDLMASATPGSSEAYEAQMRLNEHAQVIDRAAADLPAQFRAGPTKRAAGAETRVNPNRTDGQGGYFVPPLWVMEDAVMLLRAGRATADRCNVRNLPPGTDSINLPKVATGTTTAIQTADPGAVSSTDLTDNFVSGPVRESLILGSGVNGAPAGAAFMACRTEGGHGAPSTRSPAPLPGTRAAPPAASRGRCCVIRTTPGYLKRWSPSRRSSPNMVLDRFDETPLPVNRFRPRPGWARPAGTGHRVSTLH